LEFRHEHFHHPISGKEFDTREEYPNEVQDAWAKVVGNDPGLSGMESLPQMQPHAIESYVQYEGNGVTEREEYEGFLEAI
jgi:hypothetical protein